MNNNLPVRGLFFRLRSNVAQCLKIPIYIVVFPFLVYNDINLEKEKILNKIIILINIPVQTRAVLMGS